MSTAVWWIRRDLRLSDNQALTAASQAADHIIPLFILDPFFDQSPHVAAKRLAFLYGGLRELDAALRQRGSRLIIRRGKPAATLARLLAETGAHTIFAEADYSAYARRRDNAIAASLPLQLVDGVVIHHPESVHKQDGTPYMVFTPFKKNAWLTRPLPHTADMLPAPAHISTPPELASLPIPGEPGLPPSVPFPPGEAEAHRRLTAFTQWAAHQPAITHYANARNQLHEVGSSHLSPYLRFGMISARQAAAAALQAMAAAQTPDARQGAETWLSQLVWRDFYTAVLYNFPHVTYGSFRPEYKQLQWRNNPADFAAWRAGQTGYPVVDAAMRQLTQTGWMPNRARMIVASFLVKDLLIDWRWGERFFMQHLVDGDPANNNGGWQWTAGTGTDAAPYFRIFNPISQSQKFDADGRYLRRWLPELANVPARYIHAPWQMPPLEQQRRGFLIGREYPAPLVDHTQARARTLAAYRAARGTT